MFLAFFLFDLDYAKLLKRQGELDRPEYPFHPTSNESLRLPASSHIGLLQAIKFPLRTPLQQNPAESGTIGSSSGSEMQTQSMEGIVRVEDPRDLYGNVSDRRLSASWIGETRQEEPSDSDDDDDDSNTKESSSMKPEP